MRHRTILAMGGGGFSMEPENPLLDTFFLNLESSYYSMEERNVDLFLHLHILGNVLEQGLVYFSDNLGSLHENVPQLALNFH